MTIERGRRPPSRRSAATLANVPDLVAEGLVPAERGGALEKVARRYAVAITPAMAALIDTGDAADPIARQFVPDAAELASSPSDRADPIGDDAHSPIEGLVHRYPDRVLIKLVSICPVYCRFCFRRETVGRPDGGVLSEATLDAAFAYVAERPDIWEVIFSGGDPFVLSARRLKAIVGRVGAIPHVKVMRWHTRVPAVAPERVTAELIGALSCPGKATYVALHANHPRELTAEARAACARMVDAGIVMLSQTVLLKGVNDDVATLGDLMRAFVETRVKPYYLHHLDLAPGTSHLRVPIEHGQELMRALRGRLSGLCQPTYVIDIPGGHGKSPLGPSYARPLTHPPASGPGWTVEDFNGDRHDYPQG